MVIVQLKGGLGNQMFQYAVGRSVALQRKCDLILDTWSYLRDKKRNFELYNYNIRYRYKNNALTMYYYLIDRILRNNIDRKQLGKRLGLFSEKTSFLYDNDVFIEKYKYLSGYWQNLKYFSNIRKELLEDFRYLGEISEKQRKLIETISNENSVAVHVRRGDYVNNEFHLLIGVDYYQKAIDCLENLHDIDKFYFFSDDIEWCRVKFATNNKVVFIDTSYSTSHHTDLLMMRNCKHFIIANSTFSWWAAWLGEGQGKTVIFPKSWFSEEKNNINIEQNFPESWIGIT